MKSKLTEINTWSGNYKGFHYKIYRWEIGGSIGTGWNYYIFLPECKVPNFKRIWIEPKLERIFPVSPERVTHDYYGNEVVCSINLHGGITYYDTHGSIPGHRIVEIGCDYQHYGDREHGGYTLAEIQQDAENSIDSAIEVLQLSTTTVDQQT